MVGATVSGAVGGVVVGVVSGAVAAGAMPIVGSGADTAAVPALSVVPPHAARTATAPTAAIALSVCRSRGVIVWWTVGVVMGTSVREPPSSATG